LLKNITPQLFYKQNIIININLLLLKLLIMSKVYVKKIKSVDLIIEDSNIKKLIQNYIIIQIATKTKKIILEI
jgi:hypothetical protein